MSATTESRKARVSKPSDREIRTERVFDAPRDKVWRAYTDRIVMTFEWDGMPAYVIIETASFEDLGDGRTRVVSTSLFHTTEERDGMMAAGMEQGLNESYAALDRLLATLK
jgi:uncharacterized protein YndB with AHSA1/START domain